MSGPSKVIVLDPDPRTGRQVQLGFEREGVPTSVVAVPPDATKLALPAGEDPAIVLVGGSDGRALELVRRTRTLLEETHADVPIVFVGRGVGRADAEAAGADEIVMRPAYLRDVVTIGRLLRGVATGSRDHLVGSLVETTGVYTLVRALAALGRSAVLTLIRGLRRGEIRFYLGEVTSAQVGLIHGQAAFHQLMLWTDARFDFAHEEVVRRQQIPLSPGELFVDAERFLEGVRESAGRLSPATVLEQNVQRVQELGKQIPTEVHGVLRMFDGHRVLADVLEDSPYRVFETLRVAQRAVEAGLLRPVDSQRPKSTWRAVLAIEEWLVGDETREAVVERTATIESGPTGQTKKPRKKRSGGGKKKRSNTPAPVPAVKAEIDWGALVPRVIGAEVGQLSGVVPAMDAHGEIDLPTRDKPREGLEALMDTDERAKIFPTEIGLEPKVVIRSEDTDEWERVEWEAKAKVKEAADAKKAAAEKAAANKAAAEKATADKAAADKAAADKAAADKAAADKAAAEKAAAEKAAAEKAAADKAAADKAAADRAAAEKAAAEKAAADKAAAERAVAERAAAAKAAAEEAERRERDEAQAKVRENDERMRLERVAREEAEARAREENPAHSPAEEARQYAARVKAAAEAKRQEAERKAHENADRAAAAMIAIPSAAPVPVNPAAAVGAAPAEISPARERSGHGTDAKSLVRQLVSEVVAPVATADSAPASAAVAAPASAADSVRARVAEPITLTETPTATVTVADTVTVVAAADTALVTATPTVTVRENPIAASVATRPSDGAPAPSDDEPSDGVVRAMIASLDTAKVAARQLRNAAQPLTDGPPVKETTGEISERPRRKTGAPPPVEQPSILVTDLAAIHSAVSAAAAKPAAPIPDAASPSRELAVSEVRKDAVALTDAEEAFFKQSEASQPHHAPVHHADSFDDLDEGYEPPKFWDRVFGRRRRPPTQPPIPRKKR